MVLGISKSYSPSSGQIANSTSYNTDIAALFNAFSGLEAQTSTLGGLTLLPSSNSTTVFNVKNAAGTSIFAVDTTNSLLVIPAKTRYFSVSPADMIPTTETSLWSVTGVRLNPNSTTAAATYYAPIHLPNGATITLLRVGWYRDDAAATGTCSLDTADLAGSTVNIGSADSNASSGAHTVDSAALSTVVDNSARTYYLTIALDPNNSADEIRFFGAMIQYTITTPLP